MSDDTRKAEVPALKRASKKSVMKCFFNWLFFAHADYNFERLQGMGFLVSMSPVIDDLYAKDDIENRRAAMLRHTSFFNTEPRAGCMIVGLCAAMEERIASGEKALAGGAVSSIKSGLMGPLAGIGDTIFQGILTPLLLSLIMGLSTSGNIAGPVLYVILFIAAICIIGYSCFMLGYRKGDEAIARLVESGTINRAIRGANVMGCLVMGALAASFVRFSVTVKFRLAAGEWDLQTMFFDPIMPKILPLALTLAVFGILKTGKMNSIKVMLIIAAAGILLGSLGIV